MTTPTLTYAPVRDGYQFTPGYGIIETKLDGGQSRRRLDVAAFSHTIQANWVLRSIEYTDFMGFFRSDLKQGTLDFLVNLVSDIGTLTLHRARCVGGLPHLTQNQGDGYSVAAVLEVDQNPTFTGNITYQWFDPDPENLQVPSTSPPSLAGFLSGDRIQVVNAIPSPTNPAFNFDGIYTISAKPFATTIQISGAHLLNSAWGVIHSPPGPPPGSTIIRSTVTRIPT